MMMLAGYGLSFKSLYQGVKHEIQNVLMPFSLQAENLKKIAGAENLKKEQSDSILSVSKLLSSAADKIEFAFNLLGGLTESKSEFTVAGLVSKAVLGNLMSRSDIKLETTYEFDEYTKFNSYPLTLQHILSNYIHNSCKAISRKQSAKKGELHSVEQEKYQISIRAYEDKGNIKISVFDDGEDIDEDIVPKLMQESVESKDGQGIGLSFMNKLAQYHGIELGFSKKPKEFTLSFPKELAVNDQMEAEIVTEAKSEAVPVEKVFLVEDSTHHKEVYEIIFEDKLSSSHDLKSMFVALDKGEHIDLLIIDLGQIVSHYMQGREDSLDAEVRLKYFKKFYQELKEKTKEKMPMIAIVSGKDPTSIRKLMGDEYPQLKLACLKDGEIFKKIQELNSDN